MSERLASHMLVNALVRRADASGGFATVLRKGDSTSGTIVLQCLEKGRDCGLFERIPDFSGGYRLAACGPGFEADSQQISAYLERRFRSDPDLWLVELDIADAERFAAETIC